MSTGVTTIFFDGYETLFSGAMDKLHALCGRIVREQELDMSAMDFFNTWDLSFFPLLWGETFYTIRQAHLISLERTFEQLGKRVSFEHYVDGLFDVFADAPLYEDVRPALAGLESYRTGVISNADEDHLNIALGKNNLSFRVVVSSESARAYKPAPEIFHEALRLIGSRPEETLYVGDSQDDDIVGARRAGIRVAWLNRKGEALKPNIPKPDHEISSLQEVVGLAS
ncbi:MAG: HAD family hydrolase [Gemmatimonadota bacterium]|nr:HAD family hydrolase [Gemmatimonadota bacterium]